MSAAPGRPEQARSAAGAEGTTVGTAFAMAARVGDTLPPCEIHISQELIDVYASISGDFNPIHVDAAAGAASVFGSTIAHGCIPMEPVFQAILQWRGSESLPPNTGLRLRYYAPSRPGDVIRSEAQVSGEKTIDGRQWVTVDFACLNQRGEKVIDGQCELFA